MLSRRLVLECVRIPGVIQILRTNKYDKNDIPVESLPVNLDPRRLHSDKRTCTGAALKSYAVQYTVERLIWKWYVRLSYLYGTRIVGNCKRVYSNMLQYW